MSYNPYSSLAQKKVLVTGSTNGIGLIIAQEYFKLGADVFINGRKEVTVLKAIESIQKNVPSSTGNLYVAVGDVSSSSDAEKLIAVIDKQLGNGHLDILINNVGIFEIKDFFEITDEDWLHFFQVNLMSCVRLSRYYLKKMLKENKGNIIFISSEAAISIKKGMIHYSMTKAAQIAVARGLAELTQGTNVRVNSVLPGPTATPGVDEYLNAFKKEGESFEVTKANYIKQQEPTSLIARLADPQEIAKIVVFLSSDLATVINGTAQRAEGGILQI